MDNIIGVITTVEDDSYDGKDFKRVTLGTGEELKVKYGREGKLKAKWGLLQIGKAVTFTMTDFTKPDGAKIPFVSDIATVEGELPEAVDPPKGETPDQYKPALSQDETRIRSMALSYAKDLAVAKLIGTEDMKRWASEFIKYIKGEVS